MSSLRGKLKRWSVDFTKAIDQSKGSVTSKLASRPKPRNDPTLCSLCEDITWDKLRSSYLHQPDYWALKDSANSCPLCNVLLTSLQTEDEFPAINERELEETDSRISLEGLVEKDGNGLLYQLFLKCGFRIKSVEIHIDRGKRIECKEVVSKQTLTHCSGERQFFKPAHSRSCRLRSQLRVAEAAAGPMHHHAQRLCTRRSDRVIPCRIPPEAANSRSRRRPP